MPALSRLELVAPQGVWRADDFAAQEAVMSTGFDLLDAQLPGQGWPVGHMVEVLQPKPEQHAWQLLLPALSQAAQHECGPVVLVDAPFEPFGPSLQAQGLAATRLLRIKAGKPSARLWAAEQSLRCADVAAVVAWLPRANNNELRRLHIAAQQHGRLLFVFRTLQAVNESSPARLRIQVEGAQSLDVRILKRRGPPLLEPLHLQSHPDRLIALLDARKARRSVVTAITPRSRSHVLDRTAAHA